MADRDKQDLGLPVENGIIRYTSVSQIQKFDTEEPGGCNRMWHIEKVSRVAKARQTASLTAGIELHAQVEHYLKTGEMVLGSIARMGRHFIPAPLTEEAGIKVEQSFGDKALVDRFDEWRIINASVMTHRAGPIAPPARSDNLIIDGDVPVIGYIDLVNGRDYWLNNEGERRPMQPDEVELCDWKTTKSIAEYAKGPGALMHSTQMIGYAEWAARSFPAMKLFRLSHGYFQKSPKEALKTTVQIPLDKVRGGWYKIEQTMRAMKDVARESDYKKVDPNWKACGAYGGCPHRLLCPRSPEQTIIDLFGKGKGMSLLDRLKKKNDAPAETKAQEQALDQKAGPKPDLLKAIAAEVDKLKAEEESGSADTRGVCEHDGTTLTPENSSRMPNGTVVHVNGCGKALEAIRNAPSAALNSVLPPDAPESTPPNNAQAISPEAKLALSPEVRAGVDSWEKDAPATDVATDIKEHGAQGTLPLDEPARAEAYTLWSRDALKAEAVKRELVAANSRARADGLRELLIKDDEKRGTTPAEAFSACEASHATVLNHLTKEGEAEQAKPKDPAVEIVPDTPVTRSNIANNPVRQSVHGAEVNGIWLVVDTRVEGITTISLDSYVAKLCEMLCELVGAADVRCAPQDSALGFGKWKGALSAAVRAHLPEPGVYSLNDVHESEVKQVVVDALKANCAVMFRGSR
jgi:hypothetical protein